MTDTVFASLLARCFAAAPGTAPVRAALSKFADIRADMIVAECWMQSDLIWFEDEAVWPFSR
jgi:hypothetical protein